MNQKTCSECGKSGARHQTMSGRALCDDCHRVLVGMAGAGSAIGGGGDMGEAMTTGFGSAAYANAVADERVAGATRREKVKATRGFWRKMWVRVVG